MTYELETAARYRIHAEELRSIAEAGTDTVRKKQLQAIADDYMRMADQLEEIDRTNKSILLLPG